MEKKENPARPEGEAGIKMLKRMNKSHAPLRKWAFSFIEWKDGMRILDVGCGGGAAIEEMLALSKDSRIDGVDYANESVQSTLEHNKKYAGDRVNAVAGDVAALPFEDEAYDLITAVETVYFWPQVQKGISEIYRVLKNGGIAAIICEANDPEALKLQGWPKIDGHFKVYRPEELIALLKEAGFENARCETDERGYACAIGVKN